MKRSVGRLLLLYLLVHLLQMRVWALTYQDDFTNAAQNSIKSYSNLALCPMDSSYWSLLPDRTAFSFADATSPQGWAGYRVQGAEEVVVGLYSLSGSFVSQSPQGKWMLGIFDENTAALAGQSLPQASYSSTRRAVYSYIGGSAYKAYASDVGTVFESVSETPGDLAGYGVNVYTSADGRTWSRGSLRRSALQFRPQAPFVYEEYTASVPAGVGYIRVELNDISGLEASGGSGKYQQKLSGTYNCLASVAISGRELTVGADEPVRQESIPVEAQSSSTEQSSSSVSSRAASQAGPAGGAVASSGKPSTPESGARYSSAKFEGVIRSSAADGELGASISSGPEDALAAVSSESQQEDFLTEGEGAVFTVSAKNDDDKHFTAGVTVYIIVVSVALCFVVLASAGKKK